MFCTFALAKQQLKRQEVSSRWVRVKTCLTSVQPKSSGKGTIGLFLLDNPDVGSVNSPYERVTVGGTHKRSNVI